MCRVLATTGEPAPLASCHSLHLLGCRKEATAHINTIPLETSGCRPSHKVEFIFLLDPGKRQSTGSILGQPRRDGARWTSALEDADTPSAVSSGLLWLGGVSPVSLSHRHRVGKSGCVNEQPRQPPDPPEPFPSVPWGAPHPQLLSTAVCPPPSCSRPLPFLACPLSLCPAKLAAPSGRGSGGRLGTALPSPPA